MAAPTVESYTITTGTATSLAANLPPTINAGDRLILFAVSDDGSGTISSSVTDSTSDAWTQVLASSAPSTAAANVKFKMAVFEKIADGDEGGGTVTFSQDAGTEDLLGIVIRASGAHASTGIQASATAEDVTPSGAPDPPLLTASWGAEDNLFLTAVAWDRQNTAGSDPTQPSGYTFTTTKGTHWEATALDGAGAAIGGVAYKAVTATATDDPAAWAVQSFDSLTVTLVLRPAGAGGLNPGETRRIYQMAVG